MSDKNSLLNDKDNIINHKTNIIYKSDYGKEYEPKVDSITDYGKGLEPKVDSITDYGKGIIYKSVDGREWATSEEVEAANKAFYDSLTNQESDDLQEEQSRHHR